MFVLLFFLIVAFVTVVVIRRRRSRGRWWSHNDGVGASQARWARRLAPLLLPVGWNPNLRTITWAAVDGVLAASMTGAKGVRLPSAVHVALADQDYVILGAYADYLPSDVAELTESVARIRGWIVDGAVEVTISSDPMVKRLSPRVVPIAPHRTKGKANCQTPTVTPFRRVSRVVQPAVVVPVSPTEEYSTRVDESGTEPLPRPNAILVDSDGTQWELQPGDNVVGRSRDCDIRLSAERVSRHHLVVICDGPGSTSVTSAPLMAPG